MPFHFRLRMLFLLLLLGCTHANVSLVPRMHDWDSLLAHFGAWGLGSFVGGLAVEVVGGLFKLGVWFAREQHLLRRSAEMEQQQKLQKAMEALEKALQQAIELARALQAVRIWRAGSRRAQRAQRARQIGAAQLRWPNRHRRQKARGPMSKLGKRTNMGLGAGAFCQWQM